MNYGEILSTAWKKLWQEKILFVFGLLPMLPGILLAIIYLGWMFTMSEDGLNDFLYSMDQSMPPTFILISMGLVFLIMIFSWLLTPYGWAGISQGIISAESGETNLTFERISENTFPVFWRVFGFLTIIMLGYFAVFFIPAMLGMVTAGIGFLCLLPFMLILIPLALVVFAGMALGIAAIAADDLSLGNGFQRIWELLKANFWPLILMALILYLIQMAIGMVAAIPMYVGQFAFMFIPDLATTSPLTIFRMFGLLFGILIPITYLGSALGMTYNQAAWTVTYLRLTRKPQVDPDQPIQA